MVIEPTLSAWEAEALPLNYTRTGRRSMPAARVMAIRGGRPAAGAAGKSEGPARGPSTCDMQAASAAAAYRGEHRGVVAAALLHGGGGADVGIQAEQAGARAYHDGGVVAVVRQPRHRVLHRTGNRLRAGEDLLVAFLELVVVGEARVRHQVVADRVAGLPTNAADQRVEALVGVGQRRGQGRVAFRIRSEEHTSELQSLMSI